MIKNHSEKDILYTKNYLKFQALFLRKINPDKTKLSFLILQRVDLVNIMNLKYLMNSKYSITPKQTDFQRPTVPLL